MIFSLWGFSSSLCLLVYRGLGNSWLKKTRLALVGGFNHLEKYQSMGIIISYIMENKSHVWNHQPEPLPTEGVYIYILIIAHMSENWPYSKSFWVQCPWWLGHIHVFIWLVVSTPLKNMKVRLDHHPNYWEKSKLFQTTNHTHIYMYTSTYILYTYMYVAQQHSTSSTKDAWWKMYRGLQKIYVCISIFFIHALHVCLGKSTFYVTPKKLSRENTLW